MMPRRTRPLKRKTKLKSGGDLERKSPVKKQSDRRKGQTAERRRVVDDVIARDGGCIPSLVGAPGPCVGPLTAHEVVKRSQMRDAHLDVSNCIASCWFHNGWIEDNPNLARELGLVKRPAPRVLP